MRIALFYHSLISDWNHGNAHFLRGIVSELLDQKHDVRVYEPSGAWSVKNLEADADGDFRERFARAYPTLDSQPYDFETFDFEQALHDVNLVIVHEWNDPRLVDLIAALRRKRQSFVALFHDTHHRLATAPDEIMRLNLGFYDGVLAFGESLAQLYRRAKLARQVFVWHEAADVRMFKPCSETQKAGDVVWIGNWGDNERSSELMEYFIEPVRALGLTATVYGVRYPAQAIQTIRSAGIDYRGWLPNYEIPRVFSRFKLTVHVARSPYVRDLPGIPTIRVFEALACGIPLVCAPWRDTERLFRSNDLMIAVDGADMKCKLKRLLDRPHEANSMASNGRRTILERHTCKRRVSELIGIYRQLASPQVMAC
jgi:spore maturation protein CgeB